MRRQINIDELRVGMHLEANIRETSEGSANPQVLLLARGVLLSSEKQIQRLRKAGLVDVTIDTSKGKDIPGGRPKTPAMVRQQPRELRLPRPPPGRRVHYMKELKKAREPPRLR